MDYAGSFDKDEVIQHLTTKKGFRVQGNAKDVNRTILDNADQVGNNCLTYMETVDGLTTQCKIYNKMVQMLESKNVRETVGQHWRTVFVKKIHDWRTRAIWPKIVVWLRQKSRFIARIQFLVTSFWRTPFDALRNMFHTSTIVYSTLFADTWKACCDAMLHSLVVVDRTRDVGFIVYTYNEMPKNISGQFVEHRSEKEQWCFSNLALSAKHNVDMIEVCDRK